MVAMCACLNIPVSVVVTQTLRLTINAAAQPWICFAGTGTNVIIQLFIDFTGVPNKMASEWIACVRSVPEYLLCVIHC